MSDKKRIEELQEEISKLKASQSDIRKSALRKIKKDEVFNDIKNLVTEVQCGFQATIRIPVELVVDLHVSQPQLDAQVPDYVAMKISLKSKKKKYEEFLDEVSTAIREACRCGYAEPEFDLKEVVKMTNTIEKRIEIIHNKIDKLADQYGLLFEDIVELFYYKMV